MRNGTKVKLGATAAGIIAASFVLLPLHMKDDDTAPAQVTSVGAVHILPPPPPCIREHCFERPAHLRCAAYVGPQTPCADFRIDYEAHCDCVEWGARPVDGGQ